ncbi:MAG TPA: flagellar biosynthetic protein FliO [bacterium]|nr:flagellar biosynthetic protein FliO [bacterium]
MIFSSLIAATMTPSPTPIGATPDVVALGAGSVDFTWLFLKMIFAMIAVIALAIVILRYIVPKLGLHRRGSGRTDLRVVDRIPLDARKSLYVLEVEGRRLLVGASDNHLGLVADLGEARTKDEDDDDET